MNPPSKILAPRQIFIRYPSQHLETMANYIIIAVDLASEAAGLPASTATLPLFPSSERRKAHQKRRVSGNPSCSSTARRAGGSACQYAKVCHHPRHPMGRRGQLSLSQRFAQWEPKVAKRRIKERVVALVNHFSSFNSSKPSKAELIVKRLKTAMDELKTSTAARLEEERRKKKARQDSNRRQESSLGALPIPGQRATAPSIQGAAADDRQRNQANANLLLANPRSVNLHHAVRNVLRADELLGDGEESGDEEGWVNEEDGNGGNYFFGAGNDEEVVELENDAVGDDDPLGIAQPAGVLAAAGGDGGNGGSVVGVRGGGARGGQVVAALGGQGGGPNNARGDAASAAGGNNPVVYVKNEVVQAMQRRNIDTSNLHDLLYGHLSNGAQAAFTYLPVPPPPPNVSPAQQVAPAATPASIARELLDLTNLRNLYVNSPGMKHLIPGVMDRITRLQNMLNQAE